MKILRKRNGLRDQRVPGRRILSKVLKDESDLAMWAKQEWHDQGIRHQEFGAVRELASLAVNLEFALSSREPVKEFICGELTAVYS